MKFQLSEHWQAEDSNVHMMTNFTSVRASINITDQLGVLVANETYTSKDESELINGDNVIYNQTEVREFKWVVNGKDMKSRKVL